MVSRLRHPSLNVRRPFQRFSANSRIRDADFVPRSCSTPLATSTRSAPLSLIACRTFSGVKPPARIHGTLGASWDQRPMAGQSSLCPLPPCALPGCAEAAVARPSAVQRGHVLHEPLLRSTLPAPSAHCAGDQRQPGVLRHPHLRSSIIAHNERCAALIGRFQLDRPISARGSRGVLQSPQRLSGGPERGGAVRMRCSGPRRTRRSVFAFHSKF